MTTRRIDLHIETLELPAGSDLAEIAPRVERELARTLERRHVPAAGAAARAAGRALPDRVRR
jgi:hypothetical protein